MAAVEAALTEADPRVSALYERATDAERDYAVLRALRAAAAGQQDAYGRFRVEEGAAWLRVGGIVLRRSCGLASHVEGRCG